MDVLGKKTPGQKEDEEAERLVRPLPKLKPPRKDRRRERMQTERDPDVDDDPDTKRDKDLSLNYKNIGGSLALVRRVVARFTMAREAPDKMVKVRVKDTGKVVNVSEDTLKEEGSKYEKYEEEAPQDKDHGSLGDALHELAKDDAKLQTAFKELTNPKSDLGGLADGNPNLPAAAIFKTLKLPQGVNTLGDLVKALQSRPKPSKGKAKPGAPAAPTKPESTSEPTPEKPEETPASEGAPTSQEKTPEAPAEGKPPADKKPTKKPKAPPKPPEPSKEDKAMAERVVKNWVSKNRHKSKDFQEFAKGLPSTSEGEDGATLFYDSKTQKRVPFEKLDKADQTKLIADFSAKQKQKGIDSKLDVLEPAVKKAIESLADPKSEASQKLKEFQSQGHPIESIALEKVLPSLKGVKLPSTMKSLADLQEAAPALSERETARRALTEPPKRPEPSKAEKVKAMDRLLETFPPSLAGRFFNTHPADVENLIASYKKFKSAEPKDLETALKQAQGFTLDPNKVTTPPKEVSVPVVGKDGKPKLGEDGKPVVETKPFESISNEEKPEAMQRHRMDVLAAGLVARSGMAKGLAEAGVPSHIAPKIADVTLSVSSAKPEEQARRAQEAAKTIFSQASSGYVGASDEPDERFGSVSSRPGPALLSDGQKSKLLKATEKLGPHAQLAAVAQLQGEDYHAISNRFMKGDSDDRISEKDSPQQIYSKLMKATKAFKDASSKYPKSATSALEDPSMVFRTIVRKQLRELAPEKEAALAKTLAKFDAKKYEQDRKKYDREKERYEKTRQKAESKSKPAPPPPVEPTKPEGYEPDKKPSKKDREAIQSQRVASLYSSYRHQKWQMGTPSSSIEDLRRAVRTAIYHGVDPYPLGPEGFTSYPGWQQAHQRDLGASDFSTILAAAKVWLKSPVLSKNVEGMVPDARFRAALDLAISDTASGKYNRAINAPIYNMLLAKLAKQPADETLVTVREAKKTTEGHQASTTEAEGNIMTVKFAKEDANVILTRLDKLAGTIQENHAKWGMDFETARAIVNDLDKTADDIEKAAFGEDSLQRRQVDVLKQAKVVQQDSDESYMKTFDAPMAPKQTDSDEPYMGMFKDDQSQAVATGKAENGRPLAP